MNESVADGASGAGAGVTGVVVTVVLLLVAVMPLFLNVLHPVMRAVIVTAERNSETIFIVNVV